MGFFQHRSDAVGGLAGLLFGLGFLAVFLRLVTRSRRSLSPEKFESLKREMQRASLRPLGVTILAALMAADGILSILVAIVLGLVGIGHPRDFFWLLPMILPLVIAGFLKTPLSFGLSNGAGWSWTVAVLYSSLYLALWGVGPLALFVWPSLFHFLTLSLGLIIFLPYPLMILSVIVSNALSIWTLYYLNTRRVKGFFGRASGEGTVLRALE